MREYTLSEPIGVSGCETGQVTDELRQLLAGMVTRPPADKAALDSLSADTGLNLPEDYLAFMATSDGGEGDVGEAWIELWPVAQIREALRVAPWYEGVVLFAGNGANTVYGFDHFRDCEIVEGDWIGLNRDELIPHGRTFAEFLQSIGGKQE